MTTLTVKRKQLPYILPQTIQIGSDWEGDTFHHLNPAGSPVDLTGAVVAGQLKLENGTIIDLVMVVDAPAGKYTPTLPKETTAIFTPGSARYELDLVDSLGKKLVWWAGPVTLKATLPAAGA